MKDAAYFNFRGEPLGVSARDAVISREPNAYAGLRKIQRYGHKGKEDYWEIRRMKADAKKRAADKVLGDGANEESAWRSALSRMRLEDEDGTP